MCQCVLAGYELSFGRAICHLDNPLLRQPLTLVHMEPPLLGRWGVVNVVDLMTPAAANRAPAWSNASPSTMTTSQKSATALAFQLRGELMDQRCARKGDAAE